MYKETQGMQCLDCPLLHQDALPTKIHQRNKSGHNFLYPSERRHKNVPVTIIDPLVNTFSTEIVYIFFTFLGHRGSHSAMSLCFAKPQ